MVRVRRSFSYWDRSEGNRSTLLRDTERRVLALGPRGIYEEVAKAKSWSVKQYDKGADEAGRERESRGTNDERATKGK